MSVSLKEVEEAVLKARRLLFLLIIMVFTAID